MKIKWKYLDADLQDCIDAMNREAKERNRRVLNAEISAITKRYMPNRCPISTATVGRFMRDPNRQSDSFLAWKLYAMKRAIYDIYRSMAGPTETNRIFDELAGIDQDEE